jgi:predicted anti-sigma-YlaC factor YlaD
MTADGFACRYVVEILSDYLEDALDASTRNNLEEHLAECDGCTAYLDQMRLTIRLSGKLDHEDVPEPIMNVLLDAYRGGSA